MSQGYLEQEPIRCFPLPQYRPTCAWRYPHRAESTPIGGIRTSIGMQPTHYELASRKSIVYQVQIG